MGSTTTRNVHIFINGKEVRNNIRSISGEARKLKNELGGMTRGTAAYNAKMKELKKANGIIRGHYQQMRTVTSVWGHLKTQVKQFGALALGSAGIMGVVRAVGKLVSASRKLDETYADVMKTTNLTRTEVQGLDKDFSRFSTRTSREELLRLARVAGKLGKQNVNEIREWVREADKIGVALSEDLGGNVEETVRQLGKLNELFGLEQEFGSAEALNKVGSAINAIGAASTANEQYLVDFVSRVGGVAKPAGIAITEVLGLGSALDQLNQKGEVSSTVLAQVIPNMFKDTATYAKVAQMSVADFTKVLNEDTNEAFLRVLEGLNGNNEGYGVMVNKLDALGLQGKRAITVLGALAGKTELIRKEQAQANDEFTKGTSLTEEFNTKNQTLGASLERIGKRLGFWFVNSGVVNGIRDMAQWIDRLTGSTYKQSDALEEQRTRLNFLVDALTTTNLEEGERARIVKELNDEYPDYTSQVDISTASHDELRKALEQLNDELMANIILQRKKEEIEALENEKATLYEERWEKKQEVLELINEAEKKHNLTISDGVDLQTKYNQAIAQLDAQLKGKTKSGTKEWATRQALFRAFIGTNLKTNTSLAELDERYSILEDTLGEVNEVKAKMIEDLKAEGLLRENVAGLTAKQSVLYNNLKRELAQVNQEINAMATEGINPARLKALQDEKKALEEQMAALKKSGDARKVNDDTNAASLNTINGLGDAISKLNEELGDTPEDSPRFKQIKNELRDLEFQLSRLTGDGFIRFNEELAKLERNLVALQQSDTAVSLELPEDSKDGIFDRNIQGMKEGLDELEKLREEQEGKAASLFQNFTVNTLEAQLQLLDQGREQAKRLLNDKVLDYEQYMEIMDGIHQNEMALLNKSFSMYMDSFANLAGALNDVLGAFAGETERYTVFQKGVALFQIAASTASGIAQAIASGAGQPFPMNLIAIASGITAVLTGIAQAKRALSKEAVPQYAEGGFTTVTGAQDGQKYRAQTRTNFFGGVVTKPSLLVGERGPEWVANAKTLRDPVLGNLVAQLDAIQSSRQMGTGGYTQTSTAQKTGEAQPAQGMPNLAVLGELAKSINRLNSKLDSGIYAVIEWDYFREWRDKGDDAEERSKI